MKKGTEIHARDFKKRPAWFNGINALWGATYAAGTEVKIDTDLLIGSARKQTNLNDLGKDFWEEPLDRLVKSINDEARLHPIGRFITKKRLENLLCVRLRAEDHFKRHPEILEQELYPVSMIIGLQRTGTTKLQRLLASDPDYRALMSWEALNPAPIKGDEKTGKNRIKFAKMSENALKYMSPRFFAIHPVEHLAPEEDILLLDTTFLSTTAEATMHVPNYSDWLEKTDQHMAYAYATKLLKLLQWQRPGKQWVLKSPHHLEFIQEIKDELGNVSFIWTHRNVQECIPSFLSMVASARSMFSDAVTKKSVADHWVRKIGYMLDKATESRTKHGNESDFLDIDFNNLVSDSMTEMQRIYNHTDMELSEEKRQIIAANEKLNPPGKYGKHIYSHAELDVTKESIDQASKNYQTFYNNLKNGRQQPVQ